MKKSFTAFISFFQGMVMGLAELIPGVSGSNFALVMGIYDDYVKFMDSVVDFFGNIGAFFIFRRGFSTVKQSFWKVAWLFGLSLVLGTFIASALFSNVITELLDAYPQFLYALFFGLVLASITVPLREWKIRTLKTWLIFVCSCIFFFVFFGIKPASFGEDPPTLLLFIAGVVGVVGTVMPGISGPFLLLMIGLYDFIIALLASVTTLQFSVEQLSKFVFFFAGQLVGLVLFIKLLKFVLEKYPNELMAFLSGLMIASLRILYPFFEGTSEERQLVFPWDLPAVDTAFMFILILVGFVVVIMLARLREVKEQVKNMRSEKAM